MRDKYFTDGTEYAQPCVCKMTNRRYKHPRHKLIGGSGICGRGSTNDHTRQLSNLQAFKTRIRHKNTQGCAYAIILVVFFSVPLYAGGGREAGGTQYAPEQIVTEEIAAEETSPLEANTETTRSELTLSEAAQRRTEQRRLLSSIGVRVFDQDVASVDFTLANLGGGETGLRDHRGEVVFLNFWATWCPPCREEMPAMEVMHRELKDFPFRILAVSVQEDPNTVSRFIREYGYSYPILLDPTGRVSANYGVRGIPTTYFVSSDGYVLGLVIGILDWKDPDVLGIMRRVLELEAAPDGR